MVKLQDPAIIEKIATTTELSGMLNWALKGLERLREQRDFSYSATSAEIKELWLRKSDSFMAFCMDELKIEYDAEISKSTLRQKYQMYCRKHRLRSVGDKSIKNVLAIHYGVTDDRSSSGNRERVWKGVCFKEESVHGVQDTHGFPKSVGTASSMTLQNTLDRLDTLDTEAQVAKHLLKIIKLYGKQIAIDILKKQSPEWFPFESWLADSLRKGELYSAKPGFVEVLRLPR
ncbi:hypothetical protein GOV10_05240 [Candidatus Woesearchaeota archaeon]|nr:hypothetical protein [Candidatus Woesearchaeota archaeon]